MRKLTIDSSVSLLIVIPCLNEESTIAEVIESIPNNFHGVDLFEILVIDDGSTDKTKEIALSRGAKVISHRKNRGVGACFKTATEYALSSSFDLMVAIDGDLQFNSCQIIDLIKPIIEKNAAITIGSRFTSKNKIPHLSKMKELGNAIVTQIINKLTGADYTDVSCGFRCFSREALLRISTNFEYNNVQEILLEVAHHRLDVIEIPVSVIYFKDRKSRIASNLIKYGFRIIKIIAITYRDQQPLRFFWFLALTNLLPAIIFGGLFLVHFLQTGKFTGFLFAGFLSAFFASISIAFALMGILADMLVRIRRDLERVLYLIKRDL